MPGPLRWAPPMPEPELRGAIAIALRRRDTVGVDRLAVRAALARQGKTFERIAREEITKLDGADAAWWNAPCNCCGQLN